MSGTEAFEKAREHPAVAAKGAQDPCHVYPNVTEAADVVNSFDLAGVVQVIDDGPALPTGGVVLLDPAGSHRPKGDVNKTKLPFVDGGLVKDHFERGGFPAGGHQG